MILLGIDTSSPQGLVALHTANGVIQFKQNHDQFQHNHFVLTAVDTLLKETGLSLSQVDYFGASIGPGSFVGTRLAVAVIQGLAYSMNKPVVAVSHLALIAEAIFAQNSELELTTVLLDAKMQGYYQGQFKREVGLIGKESLERFQGDAHPPFTPILTLAGEHLIKLMQREIKQGRILIDPALLQPAYLQDEGNWRRK